MIWWAYLFLFSPLLMAGTSYCCWPSIACSMPLPQNNAGSGFKRVIEWMRGWKDDFSFTSQVPLEQGLYGVHLCSMEWSKLSRVANAHLKMLVEKSKMECASMPTYCGHLPSLAPGLHIPSYYLGWDSSTCVLPAEWALSEYLFNLLIVFLTTYIL